MHWNYLPPLTFNQHRPILFTYYPQKQTYNWTYIGNQIPFQTVTTLQKTFTDKKSPTKKPKK
jgi:hypothetical protein